MLHSLLGFTSSYFSLLSMSYLAELYSCASDDENSLGIRLFRMMLLNIVMMMIVDLSTSPSLWP